MLSVSEWSKAGLLHDRPQFAARLEMGRLHRLDLQRFARLEMAAGSGGPLAHTDGMVPKRVSVIGSPFWRATCTLPVNP